MPKGCESQVEGHDEPPLFQASADSTFALLFGLSENALQ